MAIVSHCCPSPGGISSSVSPRTPQPVQNKCLALGLEATEGKVLVLHEIHHRKRDCGFPIPVCGAEATGSCRAALKPVQGNGESDGERRTGAGNLCDFGIESVTENTPSSSSEALISLPPIFL